MNAINAINTNVRNAANIARDAIRNTSNLVVEDRSYTFYYILILGLFLLLGLLTYYYSTIKSFLESLYRGPEIPVLPESPVTEPSPIQMKGEEVFHINKNIYTYGDAPAVCKAHGAKLATYEQVQEAYQQGADWCSYGWVQGQQAVFPTQPSTFQSLQTGPEERRTSCGQAGVNGGFFDNPDLRFGVTCYGMKPTQSATHIAKPVELPKTAGEVEFEKKVQRFRDQLHNSDIAPFDAVRWNATI